MEIEIVVGGREHQARDTLEEIGKIGVDCSNDNVNCNEKVAIAKEGCRDTAGVGEDDGGGR